MTRDLARQPERLEVEQLKFIANTDAIPQQIRGNIPAMLAIIAAGRSMGISDMEALQELHIVNGKVAASAKRLVGNVRARGHSIRTIEKTHEKVTVEGVRANNSDDARVTWTLEDAERAGLTSSPSWKKYPRQMLWNRAVSELCRELFSDCLAGVAYTPDEADLPPEDAAWHELHQLPSPDPAGAVSPSAAPAGPPGSWSGPDIPDATPGASDSDENQAPQPDEAMAEQETGGDRGAGPDDQPELFTEPEAVTRQRRKKEAGE